MKADAVTEHFVEFNVWLDYMDAWSSNPVAPDLDWVHHMYGYCRTHWMPLVEGDPLTTLFVHDACPFRDAKHNPYSLSEMRRRIRQNNLFVNETPLTPALVIDRNLAIDGTFFVLRSGKWRRNHDLWLVCMYDDNDEMRTQ